MVLQETLHAQAMLAENLAQSRFLLLPVGAARRRDRIVVVKSHHAREAQRPFPREHHVVGLLHHLARDEDGVLHALQRRHRARAGFAAFHHRGVELAEAVEVQHGAGARVEDRVVLEAHHRRAHGVEGGAARPQHRAAFLHRRLHAHDGVFVGTGPPAAGAAVGDERDRHQALRSLRCNSRSCFSVTGVGASTMRSWPRCVLGNAITSRIWSTPAIIATMRSRPKAMPPWGGAP